MTLFTVLLILIVTLTLTSIYFTITWLESRPTDPKKRRSTWTSR